MDLATFKLRVGQRLAVVPVAGSLSAEDGALVLSAYELLVAELVSHNLAWWAADEHVPDEFADIMIGMTAARLVDEFTIPEPLRTQTIAKSGFALPQVSIDERRLRKLTALGPMQCENQVKEYF